MLSFACNGAVLLVKAPPGLEMYTPPEMESTYTAGLLASVAHVIAANSHALSPVDADRQSRASLGLEQAVRSDAHRVPARLTVAPPQVSGALPQPNYGAFGVPSLGSVEHECGLCTPCDFVHRGGCRAGVDCSFCHLCTMKDVKDYKKRIRRHDRAVRR